MPCIHKNICLQMLHYSWHTYENQLYIVLQTLMKCVPFVTYVLNLLLYQFFCVKFTHSALYKSIKKHVDNCSDSENYMFCLYSTIWLYRTRLNWLYINMLVLFMKAFFYIILCIVKNMHKTKMDSKVKCDYNIEMEISDGLFNKQVLFGISGSYC